MAGGNICSVVNGTAEGEWIIVLQKQEAVGRISNPSLPRWTDWKSVLRVNLLLPLALALKGNAVEDFSA